MSAVTMCERLDIKSCKDTEKLKKAKEEVYLKGFYEGIMLVGECIGMKVCDAKPVIRKTLMDKGEALVYFEPESLVMSRTGDEVRICFNLFLSSITFLFYFIHIFFYDYSYFVYFLGEQFSFGQYYSWRESLFSFELLLIITLFAHYNSLSI